MFAKTIVTSDAFLDMPLSARCLYFTLGMFADDDGFVNNPKSIMRQVGASQDDLNLLLVNRFILAFESGVIVIKHWKIHNYIAKDRYKETKYIEEKSSLMLDEKGAYTECIQDVYKMDTQVSIGKDSKGKDRLGEGKPSEPAGALEKDKLKQVDIASARGLVYLTDAEKESLIQQLGDSTYLYYVSKLADYVARTNARIMSHYLTILKWYNEDKDKSPIQSKEKSYDINEFIEAAVSRSFDDIGG